MRDVTLAIVRHAHAGSRNAWQGDDRNRPLSDKGVVQAQVIADRLSDLRPIRLLSSPALRCQQTLGPLSRRIGVDVEADERLFEGPREPWLQDLLLEVADVDAVLCTHGDVIPVLIDLLIDDGLPAPTSLRWHKGSAWLIERSGGAWTSATYWHERVAV